MDYYGRILDPSTRTRHKAAFVSNKQSASTSNTYRTLHAAAELLHLTHGPGLATGKKNSPGQPLCQGHQAWVSGQARMQETPSLTPEGCQPPARKPLAVPRLRCETPAGRAGKACAVRPLGTGTSRRSVASSAGV